MPDDNVDERIRRLQFGHTVGGDEHESCGQRAISEKGARQLPLLPLNPEVDFTMFWGLDFDAMAKRRRTRERRPVN